MKKTHLIISKITKTYLVLILLFAFFSKNGIVKGVEDLENDELDEIKNIENSIEDIYTVLIQIEENGGNITGNIKIINAVLKNIETLKIDIKHNQSHVYEENYRNIINIIETVKKDILINLDNSYKLKAVNIRNKLLVSIILSTFIIVIINQFWKFIIKRYNNYILKRKPVLVDNES
jgi:hypothetical protein